MNSAASEETAQATPSELRWRFRRGAITAGFLLVAIFALRAFTLEGWWRAIEVTGPSMAPTLLGPHAKILCKECGWEQLIAIRENQDPPKEWKCPNCGLSRLHPPIQLQRGQHVWIDRAAFWLTPPSRGSLVAMQIDGGWRVKRICGLPGEQISLKEGDLWIDGKRHQKTLSQLRDASIPVYDDTHRPPRSDQRWLQQATHKWHPIIRGHTLVLKNLEKPTPPTTGDTPQSVTRLDRGVSPVVTPDGKMVPMAITLEKQEVRSVDCLAWQWMSYHHYSHHTKTQTWGQSPVHDDDFVNPHARHALFPANDLWLRGATHKEGEFEMAVLFWTTQGVRGARFNLEEGQEPFECAYLDGRVWVHVQGTDTVVSPTTPFKITKEFLEEVPKNLLDNEHPIAIGARGHGSLEIRDLRIDRDIVLLGPHGYERDWSAPKLTDDHYFVLGDNVALSIDSRSAPQGIDRSQIIGKVLP